MKTRAQIATELLEEIEAFLREHGLSEREFLTRMKTNTHLIADLRSGASVTTETIGRFRHTMLTIDPTWRFRADWEHEVVQSALCYMRAPCTVNADHLRLAADCLNRWPNSP